jgi:hypothetical protein
MDQKSAGLKITIFFCQRIDADQDAHRRPLEKELGSQIRFFPLPCSGRIEPLHLMRALESGADKVYVVTCAEGPAATGKETSVRGSVLPMPRGLLRRLALQRIIWSSSIYPPERRRPSLSWQGSSSHGKLLSALCLWMLRDRKGNRDSYKGVRV